MLNPTVVEMTLGQYHCRAEVDGDRLELSRDVAPAGSAMWNGSRIERFPEHLSEDASDEPTSAIGAIEQSLARS
jgi:hypothetical protein